MSADDQALLPRIENALSGERDLKATLILTIEHLSADTGTLHMVGADGALHLEAAGGGLPEHVLQIIQTIPVGRGMAGLAVERAEPVTACNLQTDDSGAVRPGAKATGLQGSIVVPVLRGDQAVGALGIANREERTFSPEETELLLEIGRAIGRER